MLLRRLELYGFKSFASRIEMEFGPGITAIVGPNGSGKSNIADAIRWVLGEQKLKSLRGEKAEDLIFAGSDKRRSLGCAEVVLVLDNSQGTLPVDYSEVAVSRRVYRSGESECSLNKNRCRLKDIQELFLDTGVGRDTYALISQGQVEHLLTMRPEERRLLLEEAAGILKYRYRKREVLQKLEESQQNLVRLGDLLTELEQQVPQLAQEAKQERKYRAARDELKNCQITLALHELEEMQGRYQNIREEIHQDEAEQWSLKAQMDTLKSQRERVKLSLPIIEDKLSEKQESLSLVQTRRGRLEESIGYMEERITAIKAEVKGKGEHLTVQLERLAQLESKQDEAKRKYLGFVGEEEEVASQIKRAEETLARVQEEIEEDQERLEEVREQALENLRLQSETKNQLNLLRSRRDSLMESQRDLQGQAKEAQKGLQELQEKVGRLTGEKRHWEEILARNREIKTRLESEGERNKQVLEKLLSQRRKLEGELARVGSRRKFLLDMEGSFEGYHRGVRSVLENIRDGVNGSVAQLIQVDKELEKAIGVALGSTLQYIVVDDDTIAQAAIEFLRSQKGGRATFLPLNTIRKENLSPQGQALLRLPGVLGRASDLVRIDSPYSLVAENLLGRVIVVEDLLIAREVARRGNFRFRIVTLEGEVISPGGAITGGTLLQNQVELLSRKREVKELVEREKELGREMTAVEAGIREGENTLAGIDRQRVRAEEELRKAQLQLDQINGELKRLEGERERWQGTATTLRWEQEEAANALAELQESITSQEKALVGFQKEGQALEGLFQEEEKRLGERKGEIKGKQEEVTKLRVELAGLEEKIKAQEEHVTQIGEQISQLNEDLAIEGEGLDRLKGEETKLEDRIREEQDTIRKLLKEEAELSAQIQVLKEEKIEKQGELEELEKESGVKEQELSRVEERLQKRHREVAQLETGIGEIKRRLFEDFSLTPAKAGGFYREDVSPVKWRKRIRELKEELENLGNVNLRAEEQYKEVEERTQFLKQQQQDLIEARHSLQRLLGEIDTISRSRLEKTFREVQESFGRVFAELFGGGQAQLRFISEENLLEGGLEIIVQPPGKKLQSLSLLSGGEKALAAIAFLFGILQVKPSPFCVLDEIDASLDDINARRLGDFLRRYSQDTQFLIISHRQEIVSCADTLYGITMDDKGVSQFISLKLGDTKVG